MRKASVARKVTAKVRFMVTHRAMLKEGMLSDC